MLTQLPSPAIIAHRGASAHAPENTLAAFTLALQQGADAIELDAKLTFDEQIIVIHDQTVDRTTEGHGKVREFTLAELRRLDAGSHFDVAFKGEPIPTLEEVFRSVGQLTYINVELTNYSSLTDSLPERVAGLVKKLKLNQRVFFSSFNPIALLRIHKYLPEAPIGFLAFPGWKGALVRSWLGRLINYQSLNIEQSDVTNKLIKNTHRNHKKLFVYTVNQDLTIRELFLKGVDGIFTDDPVLARQILEDRLKRVNSS
jgi:glycerophosphoryl diester phosphodiesterase